MEELGLVSVKPGDRAHKALEILEIWLLLTNLNMIFFLSFKESSLCICKVKPKTFRKQIR